jgi:hypothetical protein
MEEGFVTIDPTKDISAMRNIEAVIQAGSLVRADPPLV